MSDGSASDSVSRGLHDALDDLEGLYKGHPDGLRIDCQAALAIIGPACGVGWLCSAPAAAPISDSVQEPFACPLSSVRSYAAIAISSRR
jgi:hypothetical protein